MVSEGSILNLGLIPFQRLPRTSGFYFQENLGSLQCFPDVLWTFCFHWGVVQASPALWTPWAWSGRTYNRYGDRYVSEVIAESNCSAFAHKSYFFWWLTNSKTGPPRWLSRKRLTARSDDLNSIPVELVQWKKRTNPYRLSSGFYIYTYSHK